MKNEPTLQPKLYDCPNNRALFGATLAPHPLKDPAEHRSAKLRRPLHGGEAQPAHTDTSDLQRQTSAFFDSEKTSVTP